MDPLVGYDSEAAFSRAFKKATGFAPGAWRERRTLAGKEKRKQEKENVSGEQWSDG